MSHFFALVLVPDGVEDVEEAVENLLEPYDENLEVDQYHKQCLCVRMAASQKAEEEAAAYFGTIDQLAEKFAAAYVPPESLEDGELDRHRQQAWTEFIKDFIGFCEDRKRELLKSTEPDSECEDCEGTGVIASSYNPDSKWDWWQIGGRWTGFLTDYNPGDDPRNLETCMSCGGTGTHTNPQDGSVGECRQCNGSGQGIKWPTQWATYDGDALPVRDLQLTTYPHAVITPDGEWHQESEMGWFGYTSCDVDYAEWKELVDAVLEKNHDCVVVVVDCHI